MNKEDLKEIYAKDPYTEIHPDNVKQAISHGISGLCIDGGHHKQWTIEEMLKCLGVDLLMLDEIMGEIEGNIEKEEGSKQICNWDKGIAP